MVRRARELRAQFGPCNALPADKICRNSLDMSKVDHFLNFLFTTHSLQDVAYGTTTLKYDCGLKTCYPTCGTYSIKNT